MTAGLPPVGELVQITHSNGDQFIGYRAHENDQRWLRVVHKEGPRVLNVADVTSWCRVLVLPDTAETWRAVATACTPLHIEAALREAAIR